MQTQTIVSRLLRCCVPLMHAARWRTLRDVALSAVVGGKALSLAALALGTTRATSVRHRVKCVDQLLANPLLERERIIVRGRTTVVLKNNRVPDCLVPDCLRIRKALTRSAGVSEDVGVPDRSPFLSEDAGSRREDTSLIVFALRRSEPPVEILAVMHPPISRRGYSTERRIAFRAQCNCALQEPGVSLQLLGQAGAGVAIGGAEYPASEDLFLVGQAEKLPAKTLRVLRDAFDRRDPGAVATRSK